MRSVVLRPHAQVIQVRTLSAAGHNNCEIARHTGIPRSTISGWLSGRAPRTTDCTCLRCGGLKHPFPTILESQYAYLFGLYLGDGCLLNHPRKVYRLHVFLDAGYPVIAAECEAAMQLVMPASKAMSWRDKRQRMIHVVSYSKHWPHLFPQHGPGVKHKREIVLVPWQQQIADRHPGRFLRGLIHSDGCRITNVIRHPKKTYAYPRYFFSNRSLDIQQIFCQACDRLEVAWRQDGPWNISVARRDAVAILDRHIGPKR
jgi:hypothetical protein